MKILKDSAYKKSSLLFIKDVVSKFLKSLFTHLIFINNLINLQFCQQTIKTFI
ncbi:hypothetical protein V4_1319 [Lactococcus cremoris]|nr:hypothetical protein V4_1319 [Lactococcus cremoris]